MAAAAHKNLLDVFAKEPKDTKKIDNALNELSKAVSGPNDLNEKSQSLAYKDLYEISVLSAILKQDFDSFDDYINQVHTFYTIMPEHNSNQQLMTGLHLMFLLASNRLSDFHMLLEQVPHREQGSNAYITTPVRIEQSLMEGAYNKVVLTEKNIPSPYYSVFIRIMLDTVRREIATAIEKSFKVLSPADAGVMLLIDKEADVLQFAKSRNWNSDGQRFVFEVEVAQEKPAVLDTNRIAAQTLFYAKQLEQIV